MLRSTGHNHSLNHVSFIKVPPRLQFRLSRLLPPTSTIFLSFSSSKRLVTDNICYHFIKIIYIFSMQIYFSQLIGYIKRSEENQVFSYHLQFWTWIIFNNEVGARLYLQAEIPLFLSTQGFRINDDPIAQNDDLLIQLQEVCNPIQCFVVLGYQLAVGGIEDSSVPVFVSIVPCPFSENFSNAQVTRFESLHFRFCLHFWISYKYISTIF